MVSLCLCFTLDEAKRFHFYLFVVLIKRSFKRAANVELPFGFANFGAYIFHSTFVSS